MPPTDSSPKPLQAFVAAVVAHIAFLRAPDAVGPLWIILLYGFAACTTLMVRAWLRGAATHTDPVVGLRCIVAGAFADVLLFVGAGYCTLVEPGVIKLGGVLPLGWCCAALVLIDELIRVYQTTQGKVPPSALDRAQAERWVVLAIGTVIAMGERLIGEEPTGLKGILTALFIYSAYTCWRRYRQTVAIQAGPKE